MSTEPSESDPLGLTRPVPPMRPRDRAAGLLTDLGISPRGAFTAFALALVGLMAWWWLRAPAPPPAEAGVPLAPAATASPSAGPTASFDPSASTDPTGGPVMAHAAGAVRRPGLYELAPDARVADLLRAAGGAGPAADLDRVNLAAVVMDGTQIYVPREGEPSVAPPPGATPDGPTPDGEAAAPVDINLAGPDELDTLPGVGPATAAAIIEYREAHGPFASVDELIDVPGIGDAKLAAVADLVTV